MKMTRANFLKKQSPQIAPLLRILRPWHSHIHVHHANERKCDENYSNVFIYVHSRLFAFSFSFRLHSGERV